MLFSDRLKFILLPLCLATAWGQSNTKEPHIGYLYPSGGQQGTDVKVSVGGQNLRGAADVFVSGKGVHASVIQYYKPIINLKKEERELIQNRIKEVRDKRLAELSMEMSPPVRTKKQAAEKGRDKPITAKKEENASKQENSVKAEEVKMPDHPLFYDLENKSLRELAHIQNVIFTPRKMIQPNRQIGELVLIEIKIDPGAKPGNRELRIRTPAGLTNPIIFQVGLLPEIRELEPNNRQAYPKLPEASTLAKEKALDLPVLLNGQIMPGDADRFRFHAGQGQKLVIEANARSLIPYLADAVPGWFQATLALYDANDNEVAFADDYLFNPDPVLFYQIPKDGEYELEIRDSIYRGREDFVYRISVGEQPFITQMFPLGGGADIKTTAAISGWNLARSRLPLDTKPGGECIRETVYNNGKWISNSIAYAVDTLPECNETEPNDTIKDAQKIYLPRIINGRIDRPGDIDVFRFKGRAGDVVVADVYARRLNSPLDSLLRLTDASGTVLEWNDDYVLNDSFLYKDMTGLVTHHADSYLRAILPKKGIYYVQLSDSQNHGGPAYGYRLRISSPQEDFALRVTPSSISVDAGATTPVCVYALRKDGFYGEINIVLKNTTSGFKLSPGRIPAGCDRTRMTLTAPSKAADQPVVLQIQGRARINGRIVSHPAVPAEDMMQAFLYRHLVPSQEFMVEIKKTKRRQPLFELAEQSPVRIPVGGSARVLIKTQKSPILNEIQLQLNDPPNGLTLQEVTVVPEGLAFYLSADKKVIKAGFSDNLIIDAFMEITPKLTKGTSANQKQRVSMGVLPAITIEIIQ